MLSVLRVCGVFRLLPLLSRAAADRPPVRRLVPVRCLEVTVLGAARQHDEVPQPRVFFADLLLGHIVPTVLCTFGDAAYAQLDGNQDHVHEVAASDRFVDQFELARVTENRFGDEDPPVASSCARSSAAARETS